MEEGDYPGGRLAAVGLKSSVVVLIALKALGPENNCFVKLESGLDVCIDAYTQVDFPGTVEDWEYALKLDTRTVVEVTHGTSLPLRDRTSTSHDLREDDKGRDSPPLPHAIAISSNNGSLRGFGSSVGGVQDFCDRGRIHEIAAEIHRSSNKSYAPAFTSSTNSLKSKIIPLKNLL